MCAFAGRNAASIVADGSLKMSPLLVFSAARTLNTKTCIFILKCTLVFFYLFPSILEETKIDYFPVIFFSPPVSFLLFFRGGISHEISMHGCANSSIVRLDLRINRYLR